MVGHELIQCAPRFTPDRRFAGHFSRLRQVFLYINDTCNLACKQCIYKPHVTYHSHREIPPDVAVGLLRAFHELGARKLTILGGEPTLYGLSQGHEPLRLVIQAARELGYEYLRLDTNGQFSERVFERGGLQLLDELAYSIDGFDAPSNDLLRGDGTFTKATASLRAAVDRGIQTSITCCIHRQLVRRDQAGVFGVERVIRLGKSLGAATVNFHDLFKAGVPMDSWTGDFDTTVEEHVVMYDALAPRISEGSFGVEVRLPQCFIRRDEFARNPEYYGYCPVKLGERVMVHTDGVIRICSNLICSSFGVGRFSDGAISWDNTAANEVREHRLVDLTPCTNRSKNRKWGEYVPLCFSFKPGQREYVWERMLDWDQKRVEVTAGGAEQLAVDSRFPGGP